MSTDFDQAIYLERDNKPAADAVPEWQWVQMDVTSLASEVCEGSGWSVTVRFDKTGAQPTVAVWTYQPRHAESLARTLSLTLDTTQGGPTRLWSGWSGPDHTCRITILTTAAEQGGQVAA